jgi:RNA polymerase sigma-70 factor (ECF subfamily)
MTEHTRSSIREHPARDPGVERPVGRPGAHVEELFLAHYDLVYRTAYRITGNATEAEDVLQTLFTRLVTRFPSGVDPHWPAYLKRGAGNAALDIVRRRPREADIGDMAEWIESRDPGPHRSHVNLELGDKLRSALAAMTPTTAEMFVLRHVEGYPNREIAKVFSTSPGSVAVTLFRARRSLRKTLRTFRGTSK